MFLLVLIIPVLQNSVHVGNACNVLDENNIDRRIYIYEIVNAKNCNICDNAQSIGIGIVTYICPLYDIVCAQEMQKLTYRAVASIGCIAGTLILMLL